MLPSERLAELHLTLPAPPAPKGSYAPAVNDGYRVYVSGQIVTGPAGVESPGRVGQEVDLVTAQRLAATATLQGLAAGAAAAGGSIDRIRRVLRAVVYVAAGDGFHRAHEVANGATDLLDQIFGPERRPARVALGVATLPLNAPVEVELLLELA